MQSIILLIYSMATKQEKVLVHCKPYRMKVNRGIQFELNFLTKIGLNVLRRIDFDMVRPTSFHGLLILYMAYIVIVVQMTRKARAEYDTGGTFDGDEIERLLVHCRSHQMETDWRRNTRANFLHWIDFHMIVLTVVDKRHTSCFPTTAMGIAVFNSVYML